MVVALALYSIGKTTDKVCCVEAGDTKNVNPEELIALSHKEKHRVYLNKDGRLLKSKDYLRVKVKGSCLKPEGIENNSELLVYKFKDGTDKENIKKGDILMIHLNSKNIDKIRVFSRLLDDGKMETYRYDKNGEIKMSSRPHDIDSVVGKVKFLL